MLNTGISTLAPVDRALTRLASERVKHLWIHEGPRYPRVARQLAEQSHGSHADEMETSLMLALAPHLVDMTRAEASPELKQETPGALTPSDPKSPAYSRSGSYGDPTRATSARGEALLAATTISTNRPPRSSRKAPRSTDRPRSKACCDEAADAFRWTVAAAILAAMLASALSFRADAQSEFMRGDRMPTMRSTGCPDRSRSARRHHPCRVRAGRHHAAQEKLLGWIRMSARAVDLLRAVSRRLAAAAGARRWRAHPRRHDVGLSRRRHRIPLGRDSTEDVLQRDWVMVHEMVHTALPDMPDRYAWLSEGLAVYVEPVARVQAGDLNAREIWQAMMRDMPKSLPQAGDQGLDNTPAPGDAILGRRDILPARRYRNPKTHQ